MLHEVYAKSPTITRADHQRGRFYTILDRVTGESVRYPSVTTILGAIAKPQLIAWSARVEREAVSAAAADLYADIAPGPQLPQAMYALALEQRLGKTKAHIKELAKASEIGSAAHSKIEWMLKRQLGQRVGPEPMGSDAVEWSVMAFQDWAREVALRPQFIEQVVYSRDHAYAGTLDLVATLDAQALLARLERQGAVDATLADWLRARDSVTACVDFKTGRSIYPEAFLQSCAYTRALGEMGHGRVDGGLIVRLPKLLADPGFEVAVVPPARELFPVFVAVKQLWEWQYAEEKTYRAKRTAVAETLTLKAHGKR